MIMNRVLILLLTYFFVIYIKKLFFRLKKQEMSQLTLVVSMVLIIIIMSVVINCIMSIIPELLSEKFFRIKDKISYNPYYLDYSDILRESNIYIQIWLSVIPVFSFIYLKLVNRLNKPLKIILQILLIFILIFLIFIFINSYYYVMDRVYIFNCFW